MSKIPHARAQVQAVRCPTLFLRFRRTVPAYLLVGECGPGCAAAQNLRMTRVRGPLLALVLCTALAGSVADDPALAAQTLRSLLATNGAANSIKVGPLAPASAFTGFHNHVAYYLTAIYRLGAGAAELRAAYANASAGMLPPAPRRGLVNASTWQKRIGACECGLVSGRTDTDYLDYYDFYTASVRERGARRTLAAYWPRLAAGLGGDVFHAVIQLGYGFESGDEDEMVAQGLAWCSTAYAELPSPKPNKPAAAAAAAAVVATSGAPLRATPEAALAALQRDPYPFPHYQHQDAGRCVPLAGDPHGNVCWNDAIEDLVANHSAALAPYELDWGHVAVTPPGEDSFRQLCRAALRVFAAGQYRDFYLLHLVTGSRAVWAVSSANISGVAWGSQTRRDMLTALWRATLYAYVAKLRPDVTTPPALTPPWRPWTALAASARTFTETHLAKMVFLCRDFHGRWGDDLYWQTAERVIALYEGGGKFVH